MTEEQLRKKVVDIAKGWLGWSESNGKHKTIIDIYNSHKPLARGYKMTYRDPWCATTISAAFIEAGLTDIAPTECSCSRMIELYKKLGCWMESDSYVPNLGDVIMYDWDDNGKGDCTGLPEHAGIVTSVTDSVIQVIEGNKNDAVEYRLIRIDGKYIRGYCLPDYKSKSKPETHWEPEPKVDPASKFSKSYARRYYVTASILRMRVGPNTDRRIVKNLPKGTKVTCYGYYSVSGATTWLLVKDATGATGFCSKKYLK